MALRCFVAHHGYPATLITDNRTKFIGALKILKELHEILNTSNTKTSFEGYYTSYSIR